MWHRRNDVGTGSGTTLGMRFTSDTVKKTIDNAEAGATDIEYYDLIEFSGMSVTPSTPLAVGKVFPNLKIVVIDNEELLAAMSYKSNRNYTLPDLSASFTNPPSECNGVVKPGESIYLTYTLKLTGSTGFTPTLPCQRYTVIDNTYIGDKDVSFAINNIDQLPYMRKTESAGYDGYGFYADQFVLLAQVIDKNITSRPYPDQWREIDFTSTNITGGAGETIDPLLLQDQNTAATIFDLGTEIDLARGLNYGKLNFGDERLFYGNLRTYIGATIYKTLFLVNVDGAVMGKSTNPTFSVGSDRWVSEIGILDNNSNLVLVGKLSRPIRIADSTTASIELTIDF
jgi:hypothetical protein